MLTVACPECGYPVPTSADRSMTAVQCPGCGRSVSLPADATRPADNTSDEHAPASPSADTLTHPGPASPDAPTIAFLGSSENVAPAAVGANAIPGYTILGELGRGGMGVVYEAREVSLNRTVALKVLLSGVHGGPSAVARFRTEAEAAAAIQHRNIVQVFAVGQHGGLPYMAQELVPGGSLAARLADGALKPMEAARVVEAIARGVQAAHDLGVVHRDLKPANVLFGAGDEPKVADFGLAKMGDSGLTASGAIMGTPAYMAPEQARGDTRAAGPGTDVWALGAILYECLAGHPPFRGRSAPETLRLVCEADPEPLSVVPKDLRTVALKCLEKDPARRYATAAAVADDLARFLAGEPVSARPRGRTMQMARWVGRHRGPVYIAAGALLAAAVSLFALSFQSKTQPPPGPAPEPAAKLPADLALVPPDAFAFVTVRVNDLRQHLELAKLANDFTGVVGVAEADANQADHLVEETIGVRPADMERITVVLCDEAAVAAGKTPGYLFILRMTNPVDLKPIRDKLEGFFGNFEPRDRRGRRFYTANPGEISFALFKAGERELVFGRPADVEAAIDRLDTSLTDGPLGPALEAAAQGHALVAGARAPALLRAMFGPHLLTEAKLPRESAAAVEQFRAAETVVVTLDLLPPAHDCPLPGADLEVRIRFPSEARAAEALPAFRDALRWLSQPGPHPAAAGPAALLPALLKAARQAEVQQEGFDVVVSGAPRWTAADLVATTKKPVRTNENKLKEIGLALHNYATVHGHLPPAVIRSPTGRPLYSWRIELLAFMEQDELYRKLNLKEAWDHPDNKPVLEKVPDIYAMSSDDPALTATGTRIQVLVGKGGVFDGPTGTTLSSITDGTSNTLMLIEAGEPVHWAEPRDVAYTAGGPVPKLGNPAADTFLILLADGSPKTLPRGVLTAEDLTALFTRSGNERLDWVKLQGGKKEK